MLQCNTQFTNIVMIDCSNCSIVVYVDDGVSNVLMMLVNWSVRSSEEEMCVLVRYFTM